MKKKNGGYSLIELMVVVAMLAILITAIGMNLGLTKKYNAKECRQKVVSSLENARLLALSKSAGGIDTDNTKTYLSFIYNSRNRSNYCISVVEGKVKDIKKISKSGVSLYFGPTNVQKTPAEIDTFTCITNSYSIDANPSRLSKPDVTGNTQITYADNGYKVAYNRSTGGFLKDGSGNVNLSIYSNCANYYYPVFLYEKTGKVTTGMWVKK